MRLEGGIIQPFLDPVPRVSVIVVDHHGQRFWPLLMESLKAQTEKDFELIVVDNGGNLALSADGLALRIARPSGAGNRGFAGGANAGVEAATGEYLTFLNNDTVVERDWLKCLVEALERAPEVAAACSKVLLMDRYAEVKLESETVVPREVDGSRDGRRLGLKIELDGPEFVGISPFFREGFHPIEAERTCRWAWTSGKARFWAPVTAQGQVRLRLSAHPALVGSRFEVCVGAARLSHLAGGQPCDLVFDVPDGAAFDVVDNAGSRLTSDWTVEETGLYQKDSEDFNIPSEVEVASACSMIVKRSALSGPPFDPDYFAYSEDTDLCLRLRRDGYRIRYEPRSVVRHHRSGTSRLFSPFILFHGARNRLWVIASHAPARVVWQALRSDLWKLNRLSQWLGDEYTIGRLRRSAWLGFLKRLARRALDG